MDFIFKVDPIRRNIKVPDGFTVLTMDHNVHKLVFVCPYYEDFAFDSASIVFMIDAPDGKQYIIPAEDYESFPNSPAPCIKFTLTLKSYITSVVGYMSFCITADIISSGNVIEKSWHSKNVSISIGGHIDNDDSEDIPEEDVPTINQRLNNLDSKVGRLQTTVNGMVNGSPTPVATVAEMTDESAVYLYTGSETGYTAGNWYYYDGTAWTSGGTYGGAATDTTLSISGSAADAKAVGDALALKADSADVTALDTRVTAVEGDVEDVKSAFTDSMNDIATNKEYIGMAYTFVNGGMTNGVITNIKYRVATDDLITFDRDITLTAKSGFRFALHWFEDGAYTSETGWKTGSYFVEAGKTFKMVISRTSESSSEVADILEFTQAVTFQSEYDSRIDSLEQDTNQLKNYISSDTEDVGFAYTFVRGAMTNGQVVTATKYRVTTENVITINRSITFTVASGFKIGFAWFVNGSYDSDSGWKTGSYLVDVGKSFRMSIARTTESGSEVADINEFTSAVTFQSDLDYRLDKTENDIGAINSAIAVISTPTITAHETGKYISTRGVIGTLSFGSYSNPIKINVGDELTFNCIASTSMAAISYCNADLTGITPAVIGASYNVQDYTLTADRAGYVVLSYYTDSPHVLTIKSSKITQNALKAGSVSQLYGKMTVWCGDSIMRGRAFNDTKAGWPGRISLACGCYYANYAEGGACITRGVSQTGKTAVVDQIEAAYLAYPDADLIVFDGGCNDADLIGSATGETKPAAFGTFGENDFSGNYDPTTFCGAMETICMKLSQYWLGKHVGYIVPHKMGVSNNYHAGVNNYRTYYETAMAICNKWGIKVLNMWDGTYLNPKHSWMCDTNNTMTEQEIYDAGYLYADRQHLTEAGYDYETSIVNAWVHTI